MRSWLLWVGFYLFGLLFFGDSQIQHLAHTRQALYHWAAALDTFTCFLICSFYSAHLCETCGSGTSCISSVCSMNLRSHLANWSWNIGSGRTLLCIDPNCLGVGRNLFIFCIATRWEPSSCGDRQAVTPQVSLLYSCCLHTDAPSGRLSWTKYRLHGCSPPPHQVLLDEITFPLWAGFQYLSLVDDVFNPDDNTA